MPEDSSGTPPSSMTFVNVRHCALALGVPEVHAGSMTHREHLRRSPVDTGCAHSHSCSRATKLAVLGRSRWFRSLDPGALEDLADRVVERSWEAGDSLYRQSDPARSVWVLAAGLVALTALDPQGEESMTEIRGPGDMLGALSAQPGAAYDQGARALTTSCALAVDEELLRRIVAAHPGVGLALVEDLGSQLIAARSRGALEARRSVPSRLAVLLLDLAERIGEEREDGSILLQAPLSRGDLAALASTSTESVSRTIARWRSEGIIEAGRKWIALRDRDALARLAEESR